MNELMALTKALSDETRVRILMSLCGGELCVCQITGVFGLAPSTVSRHLSILSGAGLVKSRKDSRWVFYRVNGKAPGKVAAALKWVRSSLAEDPVIKRDLKSAARILKSMPEELCCK